MADAAAAGGGMNLTELPLLALINVLERANNLKTTYTFQQVCKRLRHLIVEHGNGYVLRSPAAAPFPFEGTASTADLDVPENFVKRAAASGNVQAALVLDADAARANDKAERFRWLTRAARVNSGGAWHRFQDLVEPDNDVLRAEIARLGSLVHDADAVHAYAGYFSAQAYGDDENASDMDEEEAAEMEMIKKMRTAPQYEKGTDLYLRASVLYDKHPYLDDETRVANRANALTCATFTLLQQATDAKHSFLFRLDNSELARPLSNPLLAQSLVLLDLAAETDSIAANWLADCLSAVRRANTAPDGGYGDAPNGDKLKGSATERQAVLVEMLGTDEAVAAARRTIQDRLDAYERALNTLRTAGLAGDAALATNAATSTAKAGGGGGGGGGGATSVSAAAKAGSGGGGGAAGVDANEATELFAVPDWKAAEDEGPEVVKLRAIAKESDWGKMCDQLFAMIDYQLPHNRKKQRAEARKAAEEKAKAEADAAAAAAGDGDSATTTSGAAAATTTTTTTTTTGGES